MVRERDPDVAACSDADALGAADFRLSLIERAVASQWAQCALEATGLAEEGLAWTDVLNFLDVCDAAWLARGPGGRLGPSLAVACLAVVSILSKHKTHIMRNRLRRLDALPENTAEQVGHQENAFLEVLQWRTLVPSLEDWISMFTQRVNVLSDGLFEFQILLAQQTAAHLAQDLLISSAADPQHTPCQFARALVASCLAHMDVVDSHRLRPEDVDENEWQDLHIQALGAPDSSFGGLLDVTVLLGALGCNLGQLQQACLVALSRLRAAAPLRGMLLV
mmetsp:Transcript_6386/g.23925  ORF Transcript_6386/g.23925 Transcript_6386/m.23925 type:complete len:278 (+) Transcript_6386:237-1070(+)